MRGKDKLSKSMKERAKPGGLKLARVLLTLTLALCLTGVPTPRSAAAIAHDGGSVSGVVRDGEGKGIAGASVTLTSHSATAGSSRATSGPAGEYHFDGLSEGEYSLGAEMAGYASGGGRVIQVTQSANSSTVDLVLIRNATKSGTIRVGQSRSDNPGRAQ
jgi:hypothetical protein